MGRITSGVGVFSGINRDDIIRQLLQIQGRPKQQAQQRVVALQTSQTALLDLNTRVSALRTAAQTFTTGRVFDRQSASSSNEAALTATASSGSPAGSFSFRVDRLVSSQQVLTRSFAAGDAGGIGATALTFESAAARVDRTTRLETLNGGQGITRGQIVVRDSGGTETTVDLSRAETVNDVLQAINTAGAGRVRAFVNGESLAIEDLINGNQALTVRDAGGSSGVATSLGLTGTAPPGETLTGRAVNRLARTTTLSQLNDGVGVPIAASNGSTTVPDFTITARDGRAFAVSLGEVFTTTGTPPVSTRTAAAVTDLGGVIDRINSATGGAVTASIDSSGTRLQLTDNTSGTQALRVTDLATGGRGAATGLGLAGTAPGAQLLGGRILQGFNSALVASLRGGSGLTARGVEITARDGREFNFNLNTGGTVESLITSFNGATGGAVTLSLNSQGTGLVLKDNTVGNGRLTVDGDGAASLGLQVESVSLTELRSAPLFRRFIGEGSAITALNNGRGIGAGRLTVTDSYGQSAQINIDSSVQTVGDLLKRLNSVSPQLRARINDEGNGVLLEEVQRSSGPGAAKIRVTDDTGSVARTLRIAGEGGGLGGQNRINGSSRVSVALDATDNLTSIVRKINDSSTGVLAAVVNDGAGSARLSLSSRATGEAGRFVVDGGNVDLGLTTLSAGENSRVFFGSGDPSQAVLISGSSNTLTNVLPGVTLNLKQTATDPVTVSVSTDTEAALKAADDFVKAYNDLTQRIARATAFDAATNRKGPLLGDGTVNALRGDLANVINSRAEGVTGRFRVLAQVGFDFERDGTLTLNRERLQAALGEDPQAVRDLFAARVSTNPTTTREISPGITVNEASTPVFTARGVMEILSQTADRYVRANDGVLARRNRSFDEQIRLQNSRITGFDRRLDSRRETLERQFLAAEEAIGRLQTQQNSLTQAFGGARR